MAEKVSKPIKIAYVASEIVPFAKTGGLADVVGTLPAEIVKLGHEVAAILPLYQNIDIEKEQLTLEVKSFLIPVGSEKHEARVYSRSLENGIRFYFIDHPEYFKREGLYGTPQGDFSDNDRRFIFFQRAAIEALKKIKFKANVIHCHDWQTGLIPVYLKTLYAEDAFFKKTKTIFTIHNLAYQGNFPPDSLPTTGLNWDQFTMERLEFYGKVSFIKGGILDADAVTTVSERYGKEIQTEEFGCGLQDVLALRSDNLSGIVNGIDYKEWNPSTDADLVKKYGPKNLAGKAENKATLQEENEFKVDPKIPVVGLISRLVDQKGLDILIPAIPAMMKLGIQFCVLGTGDEKYHHLLRQVAKQHYEQCGVHIVFDPKMAKRMYAGCDFLMLPSYYEPCGLGQMIALRYGTIPLVRATGGLADTVSEFDKNKGRGNGFLFEEYTSEALLECLKRAVSIYKDSDSWEALLKNAFASDYSWQASAEKYIQVYKSTVRKTVKGTD